MTVAPPKIIANGEGRKQTILGDRHTMKLSAADTGGAFTLIEQSNDPGTAVPLHLHEREDETFYVIEGEVRFDIAGATTIATAGTTVWAPRGIPHRFENVGTKPARMLLYVAPSGVERMFDELAQLPPGPPDFAQITEICGRFGVRFV